MCPPRSFAIVAAFHAVSSSQNDGENVVARTRPTRAASKAKTYAEDSDELEDEEKEETDDDFVGEEEEDEEGEEHVPIRSKRSRGRG